MTKLHQLNVYLSERMAEVVREIIGVVERTVWEYLEETVRTRKELETFRQQYKRVSVDDGNAFDSTNQAASVFEEETRNGAQELSCFRQEASGSSFNQQNQNHVEFEHFILCSSDLYKSQIEKSDVTVRKAIQRNYTEPAHVQTLNAQTSSNNFGLSEPSNDLSEKNATVEIEDMNDPQIREASEISDAEDNQAGGPHHCKQCGKSFSLLKNLKSHQIIHRKLLGCNMCGKAFAQSIDLQRHLLTHSGEKPHRCGQCHRSFAQLGNLKRHLLTHRDEKQHPCSLCPLSFGKPEALRQHQCSHARDQPYCCTICQQSFSSAKGLQGHLRKTHPKARRPVDRGSVAVGSSESRERI